MSDPMQPFSEGRTDHTQEDQRGRRPFVRTGNAFFGDLGISGLVTLPYATSTTSPSSPGVPSIARHPPHPAVNIMLPLSVRYLQELQ